MTVSEQNKIYYRKFSPYPFRLGVYRDKMQAEAFEQGLTIHAVGISIIANYYAKKEVFYDTQLQKLIELVRIRRHNISHHIYRKKYGSGYHQLNLGL